MSVIVGNLDSSEYLKEEGERARNLRTRGRRLMQKWILFLWVRRTNTHFFVFAVSSMVSANTASSVSKTFQFQSGHKVVQSF